MSGGPIADLVRRAEELLWVLARCDVEGLSSTRGTVLRALRELEERAALLDTPDLYRQVFENTLLKQ